MLTGGSRGGGAVESAVQIFPPTPSCSVPALNEPRRDHVTFVQGDQILTCGGGNMPPDRKNTCVSLDLDAGAWVDHSKFSSDKREYASFAVVDGMSCIVGGRIEAKTTIECLDASTNFWIELPETIPGKGVYGTCAVNLPDGSALFLGGDYDYNQILHRSAGGVWDTESWGRLPNTGMVGAACSLMAEGTKVIVAGGEERFGFALKLSYIIDLETKTIERGPDMIVERQEFNMGFVDGSLVALGGFNNDYKLDSAERLNEETGEWELLDWTVSPKGGNQGAAVVPLALIGC